MALLKCKMCGGDMELTTDKTYGTCEFCGSTMTLPKLDDEQRAAAFNRGNHFRRIGEFDKALAVYERIVREDENDAEAHWCCALCRFGIEYVEDPATYEYLPTCHRASFDSFLEDVDYLAALEHSDGITRRQYQKDAAKIAEVQRGILATSQNAEPYDVFICYKESDETGNRTRDSLMAQDIYYQLSEQGRRVFFARITLEDVAGTQYEPYIFAALNSAKVMIVVGTKPEYLNAVWVKNEWSRFLVMMKKDRSKLLLPCYRDMDPYDLPEQLSVLQSYDMSKIGFIQDLTRGIAKVLDAEKKPAPVKETVVVQKSGTTNTAPLLKRAFIFLEDGDWTTADEYCEKVLDVEPECAQAYLGKLMAQLKVRKQEALKDQPQPFDGNNNYQKILRFGDAQLKAVLTGYIDHIITRNEQTRLEEAYRVATVQMQKAKTEQDYIQAAYLFEQISAFQDAAQIAENCRERAEELRKDTILITGKRKMVGYNTANYETAMRILQPISGWRNTDELIALCRQKIQEIKDKEEAARQTREMQMAKARKEREKRKKHTKKVILIVMAAIVACVVLVSLWFAVFSPMLQYNKALKVLDNGEFDRAIEIFTDLGQYKDSPEKVLETKYAKAKLLFINKNYDASVAVFTELADYSDAADCVLEVNYAKAESLAENKDYDAAIDIFKELADYSDSADRVKEVSYTKAGALADAGDYIQAAAIYKNLGGYQDSRTQYPAAIFNYANALVEQKDFATAEDMLDIVDDYSAYEESADALYVRIMDAYYAEGKYGEALSTYSHTKDYSADSDKYKDMTYRHAQVLMNNKTFDTARYMFAKLPGYQDADQMVMECDYQHGLYELSKKNYSAAINAFGRVKDYRDSQEKLQIAKYQYVLINKNNYNETTYAYLKDLKAAKYKDSADIFKELYKWTIRLECANTDVDNYDDIDSSIRCNVSYFHYGLRLEGGEPGEKATFYHKTTWPDGSVNTADWYWEDETHGGYLGCEWQEGFSTRAGTMTVKIYNKRTGELVGTFTIEVKG